MKIILQLLLLVASIVGPQQYNEYKFQQQLETTNYMVHLANYPDKPFKMRLERGLNPWDGCMAKVHGKKRLVIVDYVID